MGLLVGCEARDRASPHQVGPLPVALWGSPTLCSLIANPGGALLAQEPPGIGSAQQPLGQSPASE